MATMTPTPHQESLDLLLSSTGILSLFAHRNKNQHRLSKWWAQFDMLRRGARKLVPEVQACVDSQARIAVSSAAASGKNKKGTKAREKEREKNDELRRRMETRARWLGAEIVPRAYLAFTQLAADNQYAHLGLALVGVLAQVHTAIELLVPPEQEGGGDGGALPTVAGRHGLEVGGDAAGAPDLGVAISREEIGQRMSMPKDGARVKATSKEGSPKTGSNATKRDKLADTKSREVKEAPRKSKKSRDEFDSLFDSLETKKPPKKKKRKKDGDEFDSLFSALV